MRAIGGGLALCLAGCVSTMTGGIPSPAEAQAALNSRYAGQSVERVVAAYGMPQGQFQATSGVRVFLWETTNTIRHHEPTKTVTQGIVRPGNDAWAWANGIPYRQVTTSREGYNVDYACTMQVGVRADGTVEAVGLQGKMGACQNFVR